MELSLLEIIMAIFSLIIVLIFTYVGLLIALKYRKTNDRVYLLVGLTWIGIVEAWIPSGLVLLLSISFMGENEILSPVLYFLIAIVGYPLTTLIWITAFTDLLYKEQQRIIQIIIGIGELIFEIIFLYFIFIDLNQIGRFKTPVDVAYAPFVSAYILISLIIILVTGLMISIKSIRAENPEHKLRGYFLIAALISLFIGGLLDASINVGLLGVIVIRLLVISSAIEFYIAFILPDSIKKLFKITS
jgi:hypothetical protein